MLNLFENEVFIYDEKLGIIKNPDCKSVEELWAEYESTKIIGND